MLNVSHSAERPATGVIDHKNCNFFTENFVRAYCGVEYDIHLAVRNLIGPDDVVLEIGSRYDNMMLCYLILRETKNINESICFNPSLPHFLLTIISLKKYIQRVPENMLYFRD